MTTTTTTTTRSTRASLATLLSVLSSAATVVTATPFVVGGGGESMPINPLVEYHPGRRVAQRNLNGGAGSICQCLEEETNPFDDDDDDFNDKDSSCPGQNGPFSTILYMEAEGSNPACMAPAELDLLGTAFMDNYNQLSVEMCDPLFRRISSVSFEVAYDDGPGCTFDDRRDLYQTREAQQTQTVSTTTFIALIDYTCNCDEADPPIADPIDAQASIDLDSNNNNNRRRNLVMEQIEQAESSNRVSRRRLDAFFDACMCISMGEIKVNGTDVGLMEQGSSLENILTSFDRVIDTLPLDDKIWNIVSLSDNVVSPKPVVRTTTKYDDTSLPIADEPLASCPREKTAFHTKLYIVGSAEGSSCQTPNDLDLFALELIRTYNSLVQTFCDDKYRRMKTAEFDIFEATGNSTHCEVTYEVKVHFECKCNLVSLPLLEPDVDDRPHFVTLHPNPTYYDTCACQTETTTPKQDRRGPRFEELTLLYHERVSHLALNDLISIDKIYP